MDELTTIECLLITEKERTEWEMDETYKVYEKAAETARQASFDARHASVKLQRLEAYKPAKEKTWDEHDDEALKVLIGMIRTVPTSIE